MESDSESEGWDGDATQLDILLALSPDLMLCDLTKGEFQIQGRPLYINDFGKLEYPYGGSTFLAALMLAKHMEYRLADEIRGATVLELGAGTGTLGLTAAALGAGEVVTTDLEYCIPNLEKSIALNKDVWLEHSRAPKIRAMTLDWFKFDSRTLPKVDFIIGAELIFEEELLPPLVNLMCALTDRNPEAVLLMSFRDRGIITEDEVVEALGPYFDLKLICPRDMAKKYRVVQNEDIRLWRFTRRRETLRPVAYLMLEDRR